MTVFLEDTDAGGYVYHANYLKYLERARTMALYHKGISHAQLIAQHQQMFVVYSLTIDFLTAARLGDELEVFTAIDHLVGARVRMKQSIVREGQLLVKATITLAYVDQTQPIVKPVRIPRFITKALSPKTPE